MDEPTCIDLERGRRNDINEQLAQSGLRPLAGVGQNKLGQIELLSIMKIEREGRGPSCEVVFHARTPDGTYRPYVIGFNTQGGISDGSTVVPFVNDKYIAIITQWRPEIGQFSTELPRGAGEHGDNPPTQPPVHVPRDPGKPPSVRTALREFSEEVTDARLHVEPIYLGSIAQNTGRANVAPDNWLLTMQMSDEVIRTITTRTIRPVRLIPVAMAYQMPPITPDQHSLTALFLARPYFAKLGLL